MIPTVSSAGSIRMRTPPSVKELLEERGYLTIHQLEMYLKQYFPKRAVSGPTLKRYLDRGYFQYTKVHTHYRIDKESIDYYCEHGTEGAIQPPPPSPVSDPFEEPLIEIIEHGDYIPDD